MTSQTAQSSESLLTAGRKELIVHLAHLVCLQLAHFGLSSLISDLFSRLEHDSLHYQDSAPSAMPSTEVYPKRFSEERRTQVQEAHSVFWSPLDVR